MERIAINPPQLFTGKAPFHGTSMQELFARIVDETPAPPSSVRDELSAEIDPIILRMLAKKRDDRYPSWADLALEIAAVGRLSRYRSTIPDSEKLAALKKARLLQNLDDAELWELVHIGQWARVPSGTSLVREGDRGRSLFFLGSGKAKVTKQGRLLNLLDAGECVGEMTYFKDGELARHATVETLGDCLVAEYEKHAVDRVSLNCRYHFSLALINSLVDRLAMADERIIRAG